MHDFKWCLCYECSYIILNTLNNVLYATTNCCHWSHLKFYVHPNSVHGWFLISEWIKCWKLLTTYRQRFVLTNNVRGADYHTLIGWQANDPIVTEGSVNHILQQFIWTAWFIKSLPADKWTQMSFTILPLLINGGADPLRGPNEGCDHHKGNITSI